MSLDQFLTIMKKFYWISDPFLINELPLEFCEKCIEFQGDFEKEITKNGFEETVEMTKDWTQRIWKGEKWVLHA